MRKIWGTRPDKDHRYIELVQNDDHKWAFLRIYKEVVVDIWEVDERNLTYLRAALTLEFGEGDG